MNEITYHYLLMSQKDLLENQCVEEILREKSHYYSVRQKPRDFWLTLSPKFVLDPLIWSRMKDTRFYEQKRTKSLGKPLKDLTTLGCLISQDKEFINWIALRLGYFENIETKNFLEEAKRKTFVSDGIRGTLKRTQKTNEGNLNPLEGSIYCLNVDRIDKKNLELLDFYSKRIEANSFL